VLYASNVAYSGNVGWSNGPHLHLAIFAGGFDKWNKVQTRFRTGEGKGAVLLREGITYTRNY
jgi:murein DD-endopeptidase MepM/ murein hydrolase activator NlpD